MLVLSRKAGQKIVLGEGPNAVEFIICAIRGNRVRLGVVAPADVRIVRGELEAKAKDTQQCENSGSPSIDSINVTPTDPAPSQA